jgi:hypothetical protein
MVQRVDHRLVVLALLLMFGAGILLAGQLSLTHPDAHQVWVVYPHTLPLLEDGAGNFARVLMSDYALAFQRAEQAPTVGLLQAALLNTWALILGEMQVTVRLLNLLAGLLAFAALYRLIAHIQRRIALFTVCVLAVVMLFTLMMRLNAMIDIALFLWSMALFMRWRTHAQMRYLFLFGVTALLLIACGAWVYLAIAGAYAIGSLLHLKWWRTASIMGIVVFLLMLTGNAFVASLGASEPDWRSITQEAALMREPRSPAIHTLPDDHPLIYYDRHMGLLHGIAINIGWQVLSPGDVSAVVSRTDEVPHVWAFTLQDDYGDLVHRVLATNREQGYEQQIGDVIIARYDREP